MLGHRDFERGEIAGPGFGDARRDGAVDQAHRQMPDEIDDPRMRPLMGRRDELVQQALDLGPDALKGARRGE